MARIAGVDLPNHKRLEIALTAIYGVGRVKALEIIKKAQLDPGAKPKDLNDDQIAKIRKTIESQYLVEGDLRRDIAMNIKRLMDLSCYRGIRHRKGLPVRGQRTHTNARTRKGPRKAIKKK